jgi:protein-tyrosine-phosphatase
MFRQVSSIPCASAGTQPAAIIHPRTVATASRINLVLNKSRPTALTAKLGRGDLVVSVCDAVREELTELPQNHIHWSIADPAEVDTDAAFSRTAAEIEKRVAILAEQVN